MQKTVERKCTSAREGEKGVAHSYLGVDLSKHSILLDRYALFKVLDKPGVNL